MKYPIAILFISLIMGTFVKKPSTDFVGKENSFALGETLHYQVSFGIFAVGDGRIEILDKTYSINGKPCYKSNVYGRTTGLVSWVAKVDDVWGAYVDSSSLVPHISYRKIRENNYQKDELVKFDHHTNMIEYKVVDKKTGQFKEPEYFQAPENVRDFIGGYMFLRSLDMESMQIGDTLTVPAFFEDEFYDFTIMYQGKDVVKTKLEKINCHKMVPIMPDNKLFDGENSITVWFSDDQNKIPVRIEADMFIGKVGIDLQKTGGLLHPLNFENEKNNH